LKLTHVMYKANVNCSVVKEYLNFLIQKELVVESTVGKKRIVYAITDRGLTVVGYFRELKRLLPVMEEGLARIPPILQ
jgi:predicted transcriptional regulator